MDDPRDPGSHQPTPSANAGVARGDRVHAFRAPGITVTWSRRRCTHAAECVMRLPTVFEPGRVPWVDATQGSPEAIARAVMRCPTGALHFEPHDGSTREAAPETNTMLVSIHGPVLLRGDIEVLDEAGQVMLRDTRVALCRCGQSRTKPLCDNAHHAVGFRDAGAVGGPGTVQDPGARDAKLRVLPKAGGPLELSGPFALASADRATTLAGTRAVLCRCGQSGNKPFCDGSHTRVGFQSAAPGGRGVVP